MKRISQLFLKRKLKNLVFNLIKKLKIGIYQISIKYQFLNLMKKRIKSM